MKYFIDTNVIIDLLNNKDEAKEQLKALLIQEGSELFINRLVLIESLRTNDKDFERLETNYSDYKNTLQKETQN